MFYSYHGSDFFFLEKDGSLYLIIIFINSIFSFKIVLILNNCCFALVVHSV